MPLFDLVCKDRRDSSKRVIQNKLRGDSFCDYVTDEELKEKGVSVARERIYEQLTRRMNEYGFYDDLETNSVTSKSPIFIVSNLDDKLKNEFTDSFSNTYILNKEEGKYTIESFLESSDILSCLSGMLNEGTEVIQNEDDLLAFIEEKKAEKAKLDANKSLIEDEEHQNLSEHLDRLAHTEIFDFGLAEPPTDRAVDFQELVMNAA